MSSKLGHIIQISLFGESHGKGIGVILEGIKAGECIDEGALSSLLERRAPGRNPLTSQRREVDSPQILSGIYKGKTTGSPICLYVANQDKRSQDYDLTAPRPSHGDYPAYIKHRGFADLRGGGHFSGRLTLGMCMAGGIALQILERKGIYIGGHYAQIGRVKDKAFQLADMTKEQLQALNQSEFPLLNDRVRSLMEMEVYQAKEDLDSVGGILEVAAIHLPIGLGEPIFDSLEGNLSKAIFGIPGVKGVEFGLGFEGSLMRGSQYNDAFVVEDGHIKTKTNHNGGILGGMSTGMPLTLRVAMKPTPSIYQSQDSFDYETKEKKKIQIRGRHDPCIALRALPVVEAMVALTILDFLSLRNEDEDGFR